MEFPCEVELRHNYNSFLPPGKYIAVGRQGDFIVVEYHLGWKFVHNCPSFCRPEGKYASVHKNYLCKPGTLKNPAHKLNRKVK